MENQNNLIEKIRSKIKIVESKKGEELATILENKIDETDFASLQDLHDEIVEILRR